jgi:hypothetical protein
MTKTIMRRGLAFCILLLILLHLQPCQSAWAGDWYIVPKLELRGDYDSNINFSFVNKRDDYIFNISPSVDLNYESDISKFIANLALNGQIFVNNSNLDTINQYYSILGQHKIAPRLALSFSGGYTLDATLREELIESGFVMNRTRRQAIRANPGIIYDLSPRASLALNYTYGLVTYHDPQYSPYFRHQVKSDLRYLLRNAKTTLLGTVLGRYVDYYTIGNLYRNLGTYAGLEHRFSEEWIFNFAGGLNYNWFSTQTAVFGTVFDPTFVQIPLQTTQKTFNVSPFFSIATTRRWPKTELNVGYSLDQSPSSSGLIRQFHRINAGISHRFHERLRAGFQTDIYYGLSTVQQEDEFQRFVLSLSPNITYQITERLSLTTSYIYGWRNDIDDNLTTDRHRISVYLAFAYPIQYKR